MEVRLQSSFDYKNIILSGFSVLKHLWHQFYALRFHFLKRRRKATYSGFNLVTMRHRLSICILQIET